MKGAKLLIISLCITIFFACTNERRKADIKDINLNISIGRFDHDFWNIDTANIENEIAKLTKKYPYMLDVYLQNVVQFGPSSSPQTWEVYNLFKKDTTVDKIYEDALLAYQNIDDIEHNITFAFKRAKFFFPQIQIPNIYMHVSGFNQSVIIGEGFLSLSIDNYLGENYPIYKKVGIHEYQCANMKREKIVSDYITAWLSSEFQIESGERTLLDEMIYRGKIMYALSVLCPEDNDALLMGYTAQQWEWMIKYEAHAWGTMLTNQDIFSQDMIKNSGYLNDGPFTIHFTQDSPARGGVFIGWRIVDEYMKNNTKVTVNELLTSKSSDEILQNSGYNPR